VTVAEISDTGTYFLRSDNICEVVVDVH